MAEFKEVMKQKIRMCNAIKDCKSCSISNYNNGHNYTCNHFLLKCFEEAEAIIMKWEEEPPKKTNADKFREVFGVEVGFDDTCSGIKCPSSAQSCSECEYREFWIKEYVEPKGKE